MMRLSDKESKETVDIALEMMSADYHVQAIHEPVDELTRRRTVEAVLERRRKLKKSDARFIGKASYFAAAAVLLLMVGALVGVLHFNLKEESTVLPVTSDYPQSKLSISTNIAVEQIPASRFTLLKGEVAAVIIDPEKQYEPDLEERVTLGAGVPSNRWIETGEGRAAFELPRGVAVGLAENTSVRTLYKDEANSHVEIKHGTALFSVDPKQKRQQFVVTTAWAKIAVTGTLFTVVVNHDGTTVYLHKGSVKLIDENERESFLMKGQKASISSSDIDIKWAGKKEIEVQERLKWIGCVDGGKVFSELDNAACNGREDDDNQQISDSSLKTTVDVQKNKSHRSVDKPSAEELIEEARASRKNGRYEESVAALETLITLYPDTKDAGTALVSLGRLELKHMNRPEKALVYFDRYLENAGPLEVEALHGKSSALRMLGRIDQEKQTLEKLVREFPQYPAAESAAKRISEIQNK